MVLKAKESHTKRCWRLRLPFLLCCPKAESRKAKIAKEKEAGERAQWLTASTAVPEGTSYCLRCLFRASEQALSEWKKRRRKGRDVTVPRNGGGENLL